MLPDADSPDDTRAVPPGRHDPEGRRRQIIEAAAELIIEIGSTRLTHRLVAERASVSLGSTTRYFATLDDLLASALLLLTERVDADLAATRAQLDADGYTPDVLTRYLHAYLTDVNKVRITVELFTAAISDPALRPLAARWSDGLIAILAERVGHGAARGVALIADGATFHAATNDQPLDEATLCRLLAAILTASSPQEAS